MRALRSVVTHLVRQPLLLVIVAGVAVGPLACFEKIVDGDCPAGTVPVGNQCYRATDVPDGFSPDGPITIACATAKDCPLGSMPTCGPQQQCVPCTQPGMSMDCFNNHPGTPLCGAGGACVQCLSKDDCVGTHQACDVASGTCGACKANEDCSSGLCDVMSGTCADSSSLLYVNNSPTASCSESGSGAINRPYCTVQTGVNNAAATGKTLIIFSSTYPEAVTASSSTAAYVVTAIGVGPTPPVIAPSSANVPALRLQPNNGKQVTVALDHVALQGATGSTAYGVLCTGDGTSNALTKLTLTRATVQGNAGEGIKATNCDVTLDRDLFATNTGGGIEMATSDFTITNVVVRDNGSSGSTAGGFYLPSVATRSIVANSTFVRNQNSGGIVPAGAGCAATPVFFNNVVKGNGKIPDTNGCGPVACAFDGGAAASGNADTTLCSLAQLFVDPTANDFRPLKTKTAPCTVSLVDIGIDMAGAPAVKAPDHDFDGTPRPQPNPGMFDIGAYEAK